uniref:Chemosensory protein 11 n=1 Tax=Chrysomela lapponica TaxID=153811 RepID=A0A310S9T4_CHRLA
MLPLLPLFVCGLSGLVAAGPLQYYATKYDHIDVETILNNRRMVNYYAACLLNKGPCPPEGVEFKRILPEALRTNCLRCTEKQKTVTLRTIKRLKKEYPKIWDQLRNEWDPDDTYVTKFENTFVNSYVGPTPVVIIDRFGGENGDIISDYAVGSVSVSTPTTTIKQISYTSTTKPSTISKTSTIKKITPTTQKTTKKPITSSESTQTISNKPIATSTISYSYISPYAVPYRPLTNFGAGIQATVSLGTNIVDEFVRSLGAIGNRVVETGAEIAEVVLKNIARPL